jgi:hypothetical protein
MSRDAAINLCFGMAGLVVAAAGILSISSEIKKGSAGLPYGGRVYRDTTPILFWCVTAFGAVVLLIGLLFAYHFLSLVCAGGAQ